MRTWTEQQQRELVARLREFRTTCRPTTLAENTREHRTPFHLLVACIISLRTKDEVTAVASRRLFDLAGTASELAELTEEQISEAIYPAGFYRVKARQLKQITQILHSEYGGKVPAEEEALLLLPGVGRKTANLVLGLGFGIPAICVDTHVHRICNRLGMVDTPDPSRTETALNTLLPVDLWIEINDLMVTFGQNLCHPTSPKCSSCPVHDLCAREGVTRSR